MSLLVQYTLNTHRDANWKKGNQPGESPDRHSSYNRFRALKMSSIEETNSSLGRFRRCEAKAINLSPLSTSETSFASMILSYAVKFTEPGEIVWRLAVLEKMETEIRLQFSIKDTGIGMSMEHQKRLFRAFSQADVSPTRKYGGRRLHHQIFRYP